MPPDMWRSWSPRNPAQQWAEYRWDQPVTLDGARIWVWADQSAGSAIGVAPPARRHLEYWSGGWKPVAQPQGFGTAVGSFQTASFTPVATRCLRAVFYASGAGGEHAGIAVQQWEALGPGVQSMVVRPCDAPPAPACN